MHTLHSCSKYSNSQYISRRSRNLQWLVKVFGGGLFRGFVIDVNEDEDDGTVLHHIEYTTYDDKDQEDLSPKDCADTTKL